MYGTIARLQIKSGMEDQAFADFRKQSEVGIPGHIVTYAYTSDENPNEVWLSIVFENKEAYRANAESPEQNERFGEMMTYLAAEPEWHDGTIMVAEAGKVLA